MKLFKKKVKTQELKSSNFEPKEIKVSMPVSSFKFFSIQVNWFSRHLKDNPRIKENPKQFKGLIEEISIEENQFCWLVVLR